MAMSGQNFANNRIAPQTGQLVGQQNFNKYLQSNNNLPTGSGLNQLASMQGQQLLPQTLSKPVTTNTMLQGKSGGKGGGM